MGAQLLNWHVALAALSGALAIWSVHSYVADIRKGTTRPNAVSFLLWTVCEIIALAAQLKAGPSWSAAVVAITVINTAVIFGFSVSGYGYRRYEWFDLFSLLFSALAIGLWLITKNPVLVIVFAIAADFFAAAPTIRKAWRDPHSESPLSWSLITLASLFGTLSTEIWDAANLAFPAYLTAAGGLIFCLTYFGRRSSPTYLL